MTSQGRNAIITGGASGIGRAIVLDLAAAGAQVAVCDLDLAGATAVAELARQQGGRAAPVQVDVSSPASVLAAVAKAREALGKIHILVCSAGIGGWSLVPQISDQLWDRMLGVNLDGPREPPATGRRSAASSAWRPCATRRSSTSRRSCAMLGP